MKINSLTMRLGHRDVQVTVTYAIVRASNQPQVIDVTYAGINILPVLDYDQILDVETACFDHVRETATA